jgi:hypothetical protein
MDINTALGNLGDIDELKFEKVAGPIGRTMLTILSWVQDDEHENDDREILEAEFKRLSNELAESEEVKPYRLCEEGLVYKTIFAASIEKAVEYSSANIGSYDRFPGTRLIDVNVEGLITDEQASYSVELQPPPLDA